MLTNIKMWLETTNLKVAEECFLKPPPLPYIVFKEATKINGADTINCIADRNISVELYSDKINKNAELLIETLLNAKAIEYTKNRTWIDSEKFLQTVYDFNLYEKF